jgi:hypothetical protein
MLYSSWPLTYNCLRMSVVILNDSHDALRDTIYVGESDITDVTIHLFSLSILLHFDDRQLRVLNHLDNLIFDLFTWNDILVFRCWEAINLPIHAVIFHVFSFLQVSPLQHSPSRATCPAHLILCHVITSKYTYVLRIRNLRRSTRKWDVADYGDYSVYKHGTDD